MAGLGVSKACVRAWLASRWRVLRLLGVMCWVNVSYAPKGVACGNDRDGRARLVSVDSV